MDLRTLLAADKPVIADGGMGTMLFSLGLTQGDSPELWNVEQPEQVRSIHRGYIEAGAQIILTNSFGGNRLRLDGHSLGDRVYDLNKAAAQLARQEADAAGHPVVVGGSMGPTGQFFAPMGTLTIEQGAAIFAEQARALIDGGVDVLWIETMSDLNEVQAAVAGAREADPDFPLVATMTFDTRGRTMMGTTPEQAAAALADLGVLALGGNCGNGPQEIEGVIAKMHAFNGNAVLVAKANVGLPRIEGGRAVYDATPQDMAAYARTVRANGAQIIGACCGSTPDYIAVIAQTLQEA